MPSENKFFFNFEILRYEVSYRYRRQEGSKSGVVLQFRQKEAIDCKVEGCVQKFTDMGTAKHDQFYFEGMVKKIKGKSMIIILL